MTTTQKIKPVAVLISDIHFNLNNLDLATNALWQAMRKSVSLRIPLFVCGDLHDTKANLRGECINAIVDLYSDAECLGIKSYVLVGNHDLINEKGSTNSLRFLRGLTSIVSFPCSVDDFYLIPYQSEPSKFKEALDKIPEGSTILCHQGITGAESGEYIFDKSAVPKEWLANYRVISGHYHKRQDIKCAPRLNRRGMIGVASYIGSPYTMSFAEANDGPKGFQILHENGTLEFVPTNLRKHVIVDMNTREPLDTLNVDLDQHDLLWLKVTGTQSELRKFNKDQIGKDLLGHSNYKLDLIPTDVPKLRVQDADKKSSAELFDNLIDASSETQDQKKYLKILWRKVYEDFQSSR